MNDRNALYLLSFLCILLERYYARNCLQPDDKLRNELTGLMRSPMFNRRRDNDFLISTITRNPGFMMDVFVLGSLLMASGYFFYRAFNFERARPDVQARIPVQTEQNIVPAQPAVNANQDTSNSAAFFQSPGSSSNADTAGAAPANEQANIR